MNNKKSVILLIFFVFLLLVLFFFFFFLNKGNPGKAMTEKETKPQELGSLLGKEYEEGNGITVTKEKKEYLTYETDEKKYKDITFFGYGKYTVNSLNPEVELYNPEQNEVDMVFTLTDKESGTTIGATKRVAPGNYVYVNVLDFYKEQGNYVINIDTKTFDAGTDTALNGMHQEMEVEII